MTGPGREQVLDQLAYLIDEIRAQLPFLRAIPSVQLEGVPYEGERSIRDLYQEMLQREQSQHLAPWRISMDPAGSEEDVLSIAERLLDARQILVDRLVSEPDWEVRMDRVDGSLVEFAHGIALADAESLQAIAHRFHEGNFRFSRE